MMSTKQWLLITVPMGVIIVGLLVLILIPSKPAQNAHPSGVPPTADEHSASASTTSVTASSTTNGGSNPSTPASLDDLITVDMPLKNAVVSSPLTISGKARGTWFFEASAPAQLRDGNGKLIAQGPITAQGDWMTTGYVPFTATFTFSKPTTKTGTLILQNDNPSGDPARQKELDIPVEF